MQLHIFFAQHIIIANTAQAITIIISLVSIVLFLVIIIFGMNYFFIDYIFIY